MRSSKPSFQKINFMFRPRKQIGRKIMIELLQEIQTELEIDISNYRYVGLGAIYYYDFILFNKFLKITKMISLDDKKCLNRFEFNKPFDFVTFINTTTTDFLNSRASASDVHTITWFDYDARLMGYSQKSKYRRFLPTTHIFEDMAILARKSKENDIVILTVSLNLPKTVFGNVYVRQEFIDQFRASLSSKYRKKGMVTIDNYPHIAQNLMINTFRNNETNQVLKFRKLFSFCYEDSTPMYTLGGMFTAHDISNVRWKGRFFDNNEDVITRIDVPLLTYKEKLHLDRKIDFFRQQPKEVFSQVDFENLAVQELGFEIEGSEVLDYLKFYRYYPQYYEGII